MIPNQIPKESHQFKGIQRISNTAEHKIIGKLTDVNFFYLRTVKRQLTNVNLLPQRRLKTQQIHISLQQSHKLKTEKAKDSPNISICCLKLIISYYYYKMKQANL